MAPTASKLALLSPPNKTVPDDADDADANPAGDGSINRVYRACPGQEAANSF
jgi:hypothetical protein